MRSYSTTQWEGHQTPTFGSGIHSTHPIHFHITLNMEHLKHDKPPNTQENGLNSQ
jgi:hypothetical protein